MDTVNILYIHSMMFHHRGWQRAAIQLRDYGINLKFVDPLQAAEAVEAIEKNSCDIIIAELGIGTPKCQEIIAKAESTIPHRLELSGQTASSFSTFDQDTTRTFADYTDKISVDNFVGGILLLAANAGFHVETREKKNITSCGLYHPETSTRFSGVEEYLQWRQAKGKPSQNLVALLFYYGQLVEESLAETDALILELEKKALCPIAIFSAGIEHSGKVPDWYPLLTATSGLGAIVSCMAGRLLKHQQDVTLLEKLDVPIIQTLRSHSQTEDQWFEDPQGLPSMSAVFSQTYPEMFGAVRPTMIAGLRDKPNMNQNSWIREYSPIQERIETLCRRLVCHFILRNTANDKKRLTIVLHNNPCKGVEVTVGMAVGLDTFKSLAVLLKTLHQAGYDTGEAPTRGQDILDEILARKAIAEFRWTTVDEIVKKGGALYMMARTEYQEWFDQQEENVREKILTDWGEFPGEAMAWQENGKDVLVITGIQYGNIQIMNQPKRGCYGAKCTGEVCRILHDPTLSPPHHWFASYKYIQDTSDAVIHFGTEGALEYLPGKQNGLSGSCFSEVSLGDLPNFYVYVMDAIGEGMVAKRRGQATLVDHLGPILSPAQLDNNFIEIEKLLTQYSQAQNGGDESRTKVLQEQLQPHLEQLDLIAKTSETSLEQSIDLATRRIAAIKRTLSPTGLHILGEPPGQQERGCLLATMLRKPSTCLPSTDELDNLRCDSHCEYSQTADILAAVTIDTPHSMVLSPVLKQFCLRIEKKLAQCHRESDELLHGLAGGYIAPGPAGSLTDCREELLPTGRNFYGKDVSLLPTKAALMVGETMTSRLLGKYLEEEGQFPERVGLNIWSSDAFKSDGELFCQILTLLGVRPLWDEQDKVNQLEVIPLGDLIFSHKGKQLKRPRIDVTIETSGIMRDMVPHFCELLDKAVLAVATLDEPYTRNFIKKHTDEYLAQLRAETDVKLSSKEMQRIATFRVFSSPPGTYGVGVGLALDASAWTTDQELAEIYINWAGHGYGDGGRSTVARNILARQLAGLDIAYMKQASEAYDILDCGCYAVAQGSMAVATRALSDKQPKLYWAEANGEKEITDIGEQLQRSVATRLLNEKWIDSMREHGYQGAMAVGSMVNNLFKWSATSHAVSKEMFDRVVSTYILNEKNRKWLLEENPYSLEEISRRLLEAVSRNLWQADSAMLEAVQQAALAIEGEMEEMMGEVTGEFQGSKVEVLGTDKVDKWQHEWRIKK